MRVYVDSQKCAGHAQCAVLAPELFDLDNDGYAIPMTGEMPADHETAAHRAVAVCPERAITLSNESL